jgi:putative spermidine/putrescine transport system substrate-binding protein
MTKASASVIADNRSESRGSILTIHRAGNAATVALRANRGSLRHLVRLCAATVLLAAAPVIALAQAPQLPKNPITINVVDVAGDLALTQGAIEAYQASHPNLVAKVNFTKAPAPELPAKLQAMQAAGRSDIDLVLTGVVALSAGIDQGLWVKMLPDHAASFPAVLDNYLPAARKMQDLAQGQALVVTFMPAGPLLEYNPDKVKQVPTTPAELLAWCKANPNRFGYARPANSGPGFTFLMGLPYLLGDKDPRDPVKGWDKTWAFLKELDSCIEYYTTGTGAIMKELGEGSRDMTVTMTGWDLNPRILGIVPKEFKVAPFKGMTWVNDAHYMVIPKGVAPEKMNVVLDLMAYLLTPEAQAYTYDKGYFYPGPAVKNVPITLAPKESQDVIKEYGRDEYAGWIAKFPHAQPLDSKPMVDAFRIWDQQVGAAKTK